MEKDTLYYHCANLGLVLIGLFSIQSILNPFIFVFLMLGTLAGFFVSWQIRNSRPQYLDIFIGMLSLSAVVIIFGRLYSISLTFNNLLTNFSIALAWLMLFQSFGLNTGKSYAMLQFISICLLIISVCLALELQVLYIILLSIFLFIFIFTMRLGLVCEKRQKGSIVIGDQQRITSLYQQIKIASIMFSLILMFASFVYPVVPRFENLSLRWIPSDLLGIPGQVPVFKVFTDAGLRVKYKKNGEEEQIVDDGRKKRETSDEDRIIGKLKKKTQDEDERKPKRETLKRFSSRKFASDIDILGIEYLKILTDKDKVQVGKQCRLKALLKMKSGSVVIATELVDWKVRGTADVRIDQYGNLTAKEAGYTTISGLYLGNFSNDIDIEVTKPLEPIKKKTFSYYLLVIVLGLWGIAMLLVSIKLVTRCKKLNDLKLKDPRGFIKEVYLVFGRGLRVWGVTGFSYLAQREVFGSIKELVSRNPEPMFLLTEGILEARFSKHEILVGHSHNILELFHDVKNVILEREERGEFWKKVLFRLFLLDVLLVRVSD